VQCSSRDFKNCDIAVAVEVQIAILNVVLGRVMKANHFMLFDIND